MTYATLTDVSTRLGRPITLAAEIAQVEAWLGDVEAQIIARFTRAGLVLSAQIALDDPSLETIVRVEAEAVIRRIYQPLPGRTSQTVAVDDGSVTDRWESGRSAPVDGWLTASEWSDLLPSATTSAFSTRPGFESDAAPWPVF